MLKPVYPTIPLPPQSLRGADSSALAARCGGVCKGFDAMATDPAFTAEEQAYFAASVQFSSEKQAHGEALAVWEAGQNV